MSKQSRFSFYPRPKDEEWLVNEWRRWKRSQIIRHGTGERVLREIGEEWVKRWRNTHLEAAACAQALGWEEACKAKVDREGVKERKVLKPQGYQPPKPLPGETRTQYLERCTQSVKREENESSL